MGITLTKIDKYFGNFHVLKNISFQVESNELVALLGPSGCGKTSLLRIIAGLEMPDKGQVFFAGHDVTSVHIAKRKVGFMYQQYALFRHMTVFDNVAFGLNVQPRAQRKSRQEIKEKVHQLLKLVQLERLANAYPDQLSGGQKQRVALARCLAIDPGVLLLDEPFGALDAQVRKSLRRWLRDLHQAIHLTSIFVTHDQEEALEVADRIVVMNQGQVEQVGAPAEVYQHPKTPFVTQFLGEVNVLQGVIEYGKLQIKNFWQILSPQENIPDQEVTVYVRPHEISVSKSHLENAIIGSISHLHISGPVIHLEVSISIDDPLIEITLIHQQHIQYQFSIGDTVYLKPEAVNIFMQEQLIEFMI